MAETNHTTKGKATPGPWRARWSGSFNSIIVEPVNGLGVIAAMSDRESDSEMEANTALITAAPELLEALKLAGTFIHIEWLDLGAQIERVRTEDKRKHVQDQRDIVNRVRIKVNVAIAKAKPQ